MNAKIERLQKVYNENLEAGRNDTFAASLLYQFTKNGDLSDKQWYWVEKLATPVAEAPKEQLGDLSGLVALFNKAKEKLKFPKITIDIGPEGFSYQFSMASEYSKNPGYIYVKRGGLYIAKISPASVLTRGRDCEDCDVDNMVAFSDDPTKNATHYGQLSGKCCFCNSKLTDEKSTTVGYGKTCASNYNLPWGVK